MNGIYIHSLDCQNRGPYRLACTARCIKENEERDSLYSKPLSEPVPSYKMCEKANKEATAVSSSLIDGVLIIYDKAVPIYITRWSNIKSVIPRFDKPPYGSATYWIELAGDRLYASSYDKWIAIINEIVNCFKQTADTTNDMTR